MESVHCYRFEEISSSPFVFKNKFIKEKVPFFQFTVPKVIYFRIGNPLRKFSLIFPFICQKGVSFYRLAGVETRDREGKKETNDDENDDDDDNDPHEGFHVFFFADWPIGCPRGMETLHLPSKTKEQRRINHLNQRSGHRVEEAAREGGRLVTASGFDHRLRALHVVLERARKYTKKQKQKQKTNESLSVIGEAGPWNSSGAFVFHSFIHR